MAYGSMAVYCCGILDHFRVRLHFLGLFPLLVRQVLRHPHLALRRLRGLRYYDGGRGRGDDRHASTARLFFGQAFEIGLDVRPLRDRHRGALVEDGPVALSRIVAYGTYFVYVQGVPSELKPGLS